LNEVGEPYTDEAREKMLQEIGKRRNIVLKAFNEKDKTNPSELAIQPFI